MLRGGVLHATGAGATSRRGRGGAHFPSGPIRNPGPALSPIVIIPARLAASRLPGKPLLRIGGEAMIVRVWRAAIAAGVGPVVVACAEEPIAAAIRAVGGDAVMTDPELPSGSDRILAALRLIDPSEKYKEVINLQGDMPFVDPAVLRACTDLLASRSDCDISTVAAPEASPADRGNPDVVKAVLTLQPGAASGRALYFTRSALFGDGPIWRHIGLYGYRRAALERFAAAPPSPLERRERLEQLRALEMGMTIHAAIADAAPLSVDTPADLEAARAHAHHLVGKT